MYFAEKCYCCKKELGYYSIPFIRTDNPDDKYNDIYVCVGDCLSKIQAKNERKKKDNALEKCKYSKCNNKRNEGKDLYCERCNDRLKEIRDAVDGYDRCIDKLIEEYNTYGKHWQRWNDESID